MPKFGHLGMREWETIGLCEDRNPVGAAAGTEEGCG